MSITVSWNEVMIRLALTLVAGALVGLNRGERGSAAGLRTTILVCLAASVAMLQANMLMGTVGKASNSFIELDLMRLPLGILSGMGFIGGGAILRRDNLVLGVTTAATLWFVTVIGLCLGGGQLELGLAALALCLITLSLFRWLEHTLRQSLHATLTMSLAADGPTEAETRTRLSAAGYTITRWGVEYLSREAQSILRCEVAWRGRRDETTPPALLGELAHRQGVLNLRWEPVQPN